MPALSFAFSDPLWLIAAPLAMLPLWRRDRETVAYSWLALVRSVSSPLACSGLI